MIHALPVGSLTLSLYCRLYNDLLNGNCFEQYHISTFTRTTWFYLKNTINRYHKDRMLDNYPYSLGRSTTADEATETPTIGVRSFPLNPHVSSASRDVPISQFDHAKTSYSNMHARHPAVVNVCNDDQQATGFWTNVHLPSTSSNHAESFNLIHVPSSNIKPVTESTSRLRSCILP